MEPMIAALGRLIELVPYKSEHLVQCSSHAKGKDVKVTKRSEATYTFQMPDSKVTVEAAFAKEGTVVDQPLFSDVSKNDYFHDAVEWAVDKGITSGTSATTFSPDAPCTRGQIVTFLYRYAGQPSGYYSNGLSF